LTISFSAAAHISVLLTPRASTAISNPNFRELGVISSQRRSKDLQGQRYSTLESLAGKTLLRAALASFSTLNPFI